MSTETQLVTFKGQCKYSKLYAGQECSPHPDAITEANKNDKHFEILVECSEELFKKLKKAGIPAGTTLKEFEGEDITYIKLKSTYKRGEWTFPLPTVVDASGDAFEELIGNGSRVVATVELAPIKGRSGKVLRLKKVQVTDHIPYEAKTKDSLDAPPFETTEEADNDLFL